MSPEIFCPTCGGLIFSPDPDAMHMQPCTCTAKVDPAPSGAKTTQSAESSRKSTRDTAVATRPTPPPDRSAPAAPAEEKICIKCGKDVNGHRRLKDDDGNYWCYACAKEDDRRKKALTTSPKSKCGLCGDEVVVQNLVTLDGRFVCPKCLREQRELAKTTQARIGRVNSAFKGQEWKRLLPLLIVLGLLGLIMLLQTLGVIGK